MDTQALAIARLDGGVSMAGLLLTLLDQVWRGQACSLHRWTVVVRCAFAARRPILTEKCVSQCERHISRPREMRKKKCENAKCEKQRKRIPATQRVASAKATQKINATATRMATRKCTCDTALGLITGEMQFSKFERIGAEDAACVDS